MASTIPLLDNQCSFCYKSTSAYISCLRCNIVQYCSSDHQAQHAPAHSSRCSTVTILTDEVAEHRLDLENDPEFGNLFDSGIALWSISETFAWSHTTKLLLKALRRIPTRLAIERALDIAWHRMEAMAAVDHSGVKFMIPAFLLRLGRDQEAYDFLKWFATKGRPPLFGAEWDFDMEGEDAGEDLQDGGWDLQEVREWDDELKYGDQELLSPLVAVCLVKLRLWQNLRELRGAEEVLTGRLPREILDRVREEYMARDVVASSEDTIKGMRDGLDLTAKIDDLQRQIDELFFAVQRRNKYFWPLLVQPGNTLDLEVDWEEEKREAIDVLQHNIDAWRETAVAVHWLENKMQHVSLEGP
ncbi:unnamed protein product [Zymoseptoria tritici ST99CH_3D7]|uniref:MYND-type domain-containing protein n=1 Tax=Zymoseptoria tritici (strain ST99CH_3D7) TaxID=1276538 RepID=A0A1X7RRG6_ZYMT9|nr:unnamed protein product [Zymoseptoria tritici ST99CH_3D7]